MKQSEFSYKVAGQEVYLDLDPDHVALKFDDPYRTSARANFVASNNHLGEFHDRVEIPGEKYTVFKLAEVQEERKQRLQNAMSNLSKAKEVKTARPVFKSGNKKIIATDKIMVGFDKKAKNVNEILAKYKCEKLEETYDEYLLRVPDEVDIFKTIKDIEKEPGVKFAEPAFITIGSNANLKFKSRISPASDDIDDTKDLSGLQYAIKITQAVDAWNIQKGNSNIKIAILDEGVETDHPDLETIVVKSFDATDDDLFQEPNGWDGHGTACCGLAAARHKEFGIKGISAGCSVFAVRLAFSNAPESEWITSDPVIKRAIDWSWENGADVLSNSWGGGAPSNTISNAFERARTQGRKGKGCVVVIAAGNEDAVVNYPGNLAEVLTVSASNEFDEPKTRFSRDGESWWGSCHGPEVDVAAPGVHNLTTDIRGVNGYNKNHNYTDFNGTSSATPIVAGVAGLVLSANPDLTEKQVRDIITQSADKVGNVPYHEGHNDRMGFGRVNALNAVQMAKNGTRRAASRATKKATARKRKP
jgi:thermitase